LSDWRACWPHRSGQKVGDTMAYPSEVRTVVVVLDVLVDVVEAEVVEVEVVEVEVVWEE
jgi:hypothetical protein